LPPPQQQAVIYLESTAVVLKNVKKPKRNEQREIERERVRERERER